jgi:hypothetical protein
MLTALAFSAALLSGQDAPPPQPPLPVVAGATASPDCGGMRTIMGGENAAMQCVTAPLAGIGDIARAYAAAARGHGWAVVGQVDSAQWLQRPAADGLCDRMTIVGFWDFRINPDPVPGIPGYVGVIVQHAQACEPVVVPRTPQ